MTFEIPLSPVPLQPKPEQCEAPTIADWTITLIDRVWGPDVECVVVRSCGHSYYRGWRIPWPTPVIGEPAMQCPGPQVETLPSGRADPSLPPMKKGKGWRRLKVSKVA